MLNNTAAIAESHYLHYTPPAYCSLAWRTPMKILSLHVGYDSHYRSLKYPKQNHSQFPKLTLKTVNRRL